MTRTLLPCSLLLASLACSSTDGSPSPDTTSDDSSESGEETGDETGEDTGTPPETIECNASTADHSACTGDCPIVADLIIRCEDEAFGAAGLRVAPGLGPTYLATSAAHSGWMFELDEEGVTRTAVIPRGKDKTLHLAVDRTGAPRIVYDGTEVLDDGETLDGHVVFLDPTDDEAREEEIYDAAGMSPVHDFELGAGGTPHVWLETSPGNRVEVVRNTGGTWLLLSDAPAPGEADWPRYTLGLDDVAVGLGYVPADVQWRLQALKDGDLRDMGDMAGSAIPRLTMPTAVALPSLDVEGPDYAVLIQREGGLQVAWPSADGYDEVALPDTPAHVNPCVGVGDSEDVCMGTCEDTGTGLGNALGAIARTTDGAVWVAHVQTSFDRTMEYALQCEAESCTCVPNVVRDDSTAELIVSRVDVEAGASTESFRLPVERPDAESIAPSPEFPRGLDLRAFGTDLALGLRIQHDEGPRIRVMRLDTTAMP